MTTKRIVLEHPGAHEPDAEGFRSALAAKYAAALKEDGLKRDGDLTIAVRVNISGDRTEYDVSSDTLEDKPAPKGK